MVRIRKVNWIEKTSELQTALTHHNNENYLKIILENYFLYNSYARADIAKILKEKLDETREKTPQQLAVQKNIFLELYSKYIQVTEDLALVNLMMLSSSATKSSIEIYMESQNTDILGFYKMAHAGLSDTQIAKIMGVDKLKQYIRSAKHLSIKEVEDYKFLIDESIKIERNNMKMLAGIYIEEVTDENGKKTLRQAGPIDVYNGIKHGFKLMQATKRTKELWKDLKDSTVNVMHQVVFDEASGQKIVALGGFEEINDEILNPIMHNIEHFSESLHHICEIRLWTERDPMYVIKRFRLTKTEEELKKRKVKVNKLCPCNSGQKYKKCCRLFSFEHQKTNPYSLVDM